MNLRTIEPDRLIGSWLVDVTKHAGPEKALRCEEIIKGPKLLNNPEADLGRMTFRSVRVGGSTGFTLTQDYVLRMAELAEE